MAAGGNVVSEKENKRLEFTVIEHWLLMSQSCSYHCWAKLMSPVSMSYPCGLCRS